MEPQKSSLSVSGNRALLFLVFLVIGYIIQGKIIESLPPISPILFWIAWSVISLVLSFVLVRQNKTTPSKTELAFYKTVIALTLILFIVGGVLQDIKLIVITLGIFLVVLFYAIIIKQVNLDVGLHQYEILSTDELKRRFNREVLISSIFTVLIVFFTLYFLGVYALIRAFIFAIPTIIISISRMVKIKKLLSEIR
jgi:hypothetical protein